MKSLNLAKASQTTRIPSSLLGQSSASGRVPTKMIFTFGKPKTETLTTKKAELMENLKGLGRGVDASEADKQRINKLATELEKLNPTKNVLGPELSAKWKLLYTTSDSILGTSRPPFLRPFGDIFQTIDAENLKARNQETVPFFNAVEAELIPVNKKKVNVQFKTFYILGLIPITAPASAKGELEVTYLDNDLRISRGNKGNLFILSRNGKK
jgi:PAP_fibrillin